MITWAHRTRDASIARRLVIEIRAAAYTQTPISRRTVERDVNYIRFMERSISVHCNRQLLARIVRDEG